MRRSRPTAEHSPGRRSRLFLFSLMVPILLVTMACELLQQPQASGREAALPQGFDALRVPDVPLVAALYFNQGDVVSASPGALDLSPANGDGQASPIALASFALLLGAGKDAEAVQATVATEDGAQALAAIARGAVADDGGWVIVDGTTVTFAGKGGDWSSALKTAVESGSTVALSTAYPEAWKTVQLLPSDPPQPPVVVGVLLSLDDLKQRLADAQTTALNHLGTVLSVVPSQGGVAFAGYTADDVDLMTTEVDAAFVERINLHGVVAFRTGLLGAVLPTVLGTLSGALSLEPIQHGDRQVYRYQRDYGAALVVPSGGAFYVVAAPGAPITDEDLLGYLDSAE